RVKDARLVGQDQPVGHGNVHRPGRQVFYRLIDDLEALEHFVHAYEIPMETIADRRADDLEIEIAIGQIRLVLAQVAGDAAGPRDRPGRRAVDRLGFRQDANAFGALDEDAIAVEQPADLAVDLWKTADEVADLFDELGRGVVHQPAHASIAVRKSRTAQSF